MEKDNILTEKSHWENNWQAPVRLCLPRKASSGVANIMRLLKSRIPSGSKYLEIGCAPGKLLAWVAARLHAEVAGIDYSVNGMKTNRILFEKLSLSGDLRCEDIFSHSFGENVFDVIFSNGVIEHFNDPRQLIEIHLQLLRPGGRAIIIVPNYSGIYLKMQNIFNPDNLAIHNLNIMSPSALMQLADMPMVGSKRSYYFGRFSPGLISWEKKLPKPLAQMISLFFNAVGMIQPFDVQALSPSIVLEIVKKDDSHIIL